MAGLSPMRAGLRRAASVLRHSFILALGLACGFSAGDETVVAAASSLRAAMPDLVASFDRDGLTSPLAITYGSSGSLRAQVEAGAPIDLVVFAGAAPIDTLIASGLAAAQTRRVIARNRLVLVGRDDAESDPIEFRSLTRIAAGERIAIGDPDTVPAGAYARETLSALGIWEALQDRLIPAPTVAAVLAYVERGEVAVGVVYETDVALGRRIRILDRADLDSANDPVVVAALTGDGLSDRHASAFLEYLSGDVGRAILARHGFLPP